MARIGLFFMCFNADHSPLDFMQNIHYHPAISNTKKMTIDDIKKTFRTPAAGDYPELQHYSRAEIYEGKMGPGGLYLAAQMARRMDPAAGQRVLDLGCGRGTTSAFLAGQYRVSVIAVDLWVRADDLYKRFRKDGLDHNIVPLNLDIRDKLPFAAGYFDAIFCMDSIHYFGGELDFWHHLLPHLKTGGVLCIGSPCFNAEFSAEMLQDLPPVYDDGTDLWPTEFSRYHSPGWWKNLLQQTSCMDVKESAEIEDGIIFWEDDVLHSLEQGGNVEDATTDAAQITFRRKGMPYLTHFILRAIKKAAKQDPAAMPRPFRERSWRGGLLSPRRTPECRRAARGGRSGPKSG